MTYGIRAVLSALAVAFTAYLAVGALLWTTPPAHPVVQVVAIACYLATTWVCIFWKARPAGDADSLTRRLGEQQVLPLWAGVLALAVAAVVPTASWFAAGPGALLADYATWSMGAVGALMAIVMVRRRPWTAWAGVVLVTVAAAVWIGIADALAFGVVGVVLWVGVAQLLSGLLDRAARDAAELADLQRAASEWLATQEGMRRERRTQVQRALAVAGPVLARVVAADGHLDAVERRLAGIAEETLRDELRGTALLDDEVRAALGAARARGAAVSVHDDGGLDDVPPAGRAAVRAELAHVIADARSERLYVRASRHGAVVVTVVGRTVGADGEDAVDLWQELSAPDLVAPDA